MIETPGDAIIIVPLLKGFMDSSLKNDEVLLKLLNLFQKAAESKKAGESDDSLTDSTISLGILALTQSTNRLSDLMTHLNLGLVVVT